MKIKENKKNFLKNVDFFYKYEKKEFFYRKKMRKNVIHYIDFNLYSYKISQIRKIHKKKIHFSKETNYVFIKISLFWFSSCRFFFSYFKSSFINKIFIKKHFVIFVYFSDFSQNLKLFYEFFCVLILLFFLTYFFFHFCLNLSFLLCLFKNYLL